jgi:phage replication initiation protein
MRGTAVIDWLSFTFEGWPDSGDIGRMVQVWLKEWIQGPCQGLEGNGMHGFEHSVQFFSVHDHEIVPIGICAWGGKNQKGRIYVSINGTGCSLIQDWPCVRRIMEGISARITRADVAVDALNGEFTVEQAATWYEEGGFTSGGRRPNYRCDGDWLMPQGSGRTLYVGKRQNGKYTRVYEKGKQLGNRESNWTRFEVELHNVDRVIPHDVVTEPSKYFAGCFPVCEGLVDVGAERIRTLREESEISLNRLKSYCKIAYGKLLYVVRHIVKDEDSVLLDELVEQGVPRRLEKVLPALLQEASAASPPLGDSHG